MSEEQHLREQLEEEIRKRKELEEERERQRRQEALLAQAYSSDEFTMVCAQKISENNKKRLNALKIKNRRRPAVAEEQQRPSLSPSPDLAVAGPSGLNCRRTPELFRQTYSPTVYMISSDSDNEEPAIAGSSGSGQQETHAQRSCEAFSPISQASSPSPETETPVVPPINSRIRLMSILSITSAQPSRSTSYHRAEAELGPLPSVVGQDVPSNAVNAESANINSLNLSSDTEHTPQHSASKRCYSTMCGPGSANSSTVVTTKSSISVQRTPQKESSSSAVNPLQTSPPNQSLPTIRNAQPVRIYSRRLTTVSPQSKNDKESSVLRNLLKESEPSLRRPASRRSYSTMWGPGSARTSTMVTTDPSLSTRLPSQQASSASAVNPLQRRSSPNRNVPTVNVGNVQPNRICSRRLTTVSPQSQNDQEASVRARNPFKESEPTPRRPASKRSYSTIWGPGSASTSNVVTTKASLPVHRPSQQESFTSAVNPLQTTSPQNQSVPTTVNVGNTQPSRINSRRLTTVSPQSQNDQDTSAPGGFTFEELVSMFPPISLLGASTLLMPQSESSSMPPPEPSQMPPSELSSMPPSEQSPVPLSEPSSIPPSEQSPMPPSEPPTSDFNNFEEAPQTIQQQEEQQSMPAPHGFYPVINPFIRPERPAVPEFMPVRYQDSGLTSASGFRHPEASPLVALNAMLEQGPTNQISQSHDSRGHLRTMDMQRTDQDQYNQPQPQSSMGERSMSMWCAPGQFNEQHPLQSNLERNCSNQCQAGQFNQPETVYQFNQPQPQTSMVGRSMSMWCAPGQYNQPETMPSMLPNLAQAIAFLCNTGENTPVQRQTNYQHHPQRSTRHRQMTHNQQQNFTSIEPTPVPRQTDYHHHQQRPLPRHPQMAQNQIRNFTPSEPTPVPRQTDYHHHQQRPPLRHPQMAQNQIHNFTPPEPTSDPRQTGYHHHQQRPTPRYPQMAQNQLRNFTPSEPTPASRQTEYHHYPQRPTFRHPRMAQNQYHNFTPSEPTPAPRQTDYHHRPQRPTFRRPRMAQNQYHNFTPSEIPPAQRETNYHQHPQGPPSRFPRMAQPTEQQHQLRDCTSSCLMPPPALPSQHCCRYCGKVTRTAAGMKLHLRRVCEKHLY